MANQILFAALLIVAIGLVTGQTSSRQSSEDHIHDLIRQAKAKCGDCQDAADKVLARPDKSDMCDAVDLYQACAFFACNGGSSVKSLYTQAQDICAESSEDHIHDLIRQARAKCGECHDAADKVLARPDKSDMCDAVDLYQACAFFACNGGSSVKSLYTQAQDICDGASVVQVSVLTLLLAVLARFLM
ncbi:uncharacterized protein LOC106055330 [Biomphalaria glabrata]|uniref:Uncharacterized protein LOC106055330 n=1 Tax=Biomphalaria glabrata TaxID=6526 RepID=A0A9W2ZAM8_BIOGL|nr:uncharacterized protein LOC106055330 [Biomphalaria glabrata]